MKIQVHLWIVDTLYYMRGNVRKRNRKETGDSDSSSNGAKKKTNKQKNKIRFISYAGTRARKKRLVASTTHHDTTYSYNMKPVA